MDSLENISKTLKAYLKNEVRFYTAKGIEKSSLVLGLVFTLFLVAGFGFIALVFATIALGNFLNELFNSTSMGYLIMAGSYALIIISIFISMIVRKVPMFTNLFIRSLAGLLNIENEENNVN